MKTPTDEHFERCAKAILEGAASFGRRAKEIYEDALYLTPEAFDKKWPVETHKVTKRQRDDS